MRQGDVVLCTRGGFGVCEGQRYVVAAADDFDTVRLAGVTGLHLAEDFQVIYPSRRAERIRWPQLAYECGAIVVTVVALCWLAVSILRAVAR